jgi:hypothetical protein
MELYKYSERVKIVGRRIPDRGNLIGAAEFLKLVIRLHGGKPFIPKGVHRFTHFEESQQWTIRMMAREMNPDLHH